MVRIIREISSLLHSLVAGMDIATKELQNGAGGFEK